MKKKTYTVHTGNLRKFIKKSLGKKAKRKELKRGRKKKVIV
jgi:hypothetical protein